MDHELIWSLLILFFLFKKNPRLCHFKSDRDELWRDCSSSRCTSIDVVRFLMWCRYVQDGDMTSEQCCHLVTHAGSVRPVCEVVYLLGAGCWYGVDRAGTARVIYHWVQVGAMLCCAVWQYSTAARWLNFRPARPHCLWVWLNIIPSACRPLLSAVTTLCP